MKSLLVRVEGRFSGFVGSSIGIVAGREWGKRDVDIREPFGRALVAYETVEI